MTVTVKHQLVALDYVVISLMLIISTVIGFKCRLTKNDQTSTDEYLMAGKNMFLLPVILSFSVTLVSGVVLIVVPTEIYKYDFQFVFFVLGLIVGITAAANVFIPVYFRSGVSTIHEYLEIRFGKKIKYIVSTTFLIQTAIILSVILFPPVLALSAVTDLSIELSIILCGSVCTIYCLFGGLKGVLWTDVFQSILMFTFLITIYVVGIRDAGGLKNVYEAARFGEKFNMDFRFSLTKRYTFWSMFTLGLVHGFGSYGANQMEVQRILCLKNEKRGKIALHIGSIFVAILYLLVIGLGLIMYAVFFSCDPVLNNEETGIKKYAQLIPYYLVNRFSSLPGMTGLCIAGIFSGSLSSISSALNSLVTVIVLDIVKPLCKTMNFTNIKYVVAAKGLTLMFGLSCTALPFLIMRISSVIQMAVALPGIVEGPMAAVFAAGVLSRRVSEKCAIIGFLVGFAFNSWISYGILTTNHQEPTINLGTNCTLTSTESSILKDSTLICSPLNICSTPQTPYIENEPFALYSISFMWIRQIGFIVSVAVMFITVVIISCSRKIISYADSKCLCLNPLTRFWSSEK